MSDFFKASPTAGSIPFDKLNLAFTKDNVQEVFEEIRKNTVYTPDYLTTVLNTTENLHNSTLNFITGTQTGFNLRVPDATTLFNGQNYIVANQSSTSISILNNSNTQLFEVLAGSIAFIFLRSNSTPNGIWEGFIVSGFATGILSYKLTSSIDFVSASPTDTIITGLSLIPAAGEYAVWYSSSIIITTNNRFSDCLLYKNGAAVADTRRTVQGTSSNFSSSHQTTGVISVNGSESIDVRVNISGGNMTTSNRTLLLIRLGPEQV